MRHWRHDDERTTIRVAPPRTIEDLAGRIERAYGLRGGAWRSGCSTERVWSAAAETLFQACQVDPTLPLDPELYVAAQPIDAQWGDPWAELAGAAAARRYARRVRRIVLGLRAELRGEVRRAEARVRGGASVEAVLLPSNRALSPLGCFIVAHRAGRSDLAGQFRPLAEDQHLSCPLYRQACRSLLPGEAYPERDRDRVRDPRPTARWLSGPGPLAAERN